MRILAIETSCDDTAAAILANGKILSNVVSSQTQLHAKYGGIFPSLAKREHQKNLVFVLEKALRKPNFLISNLKSQISNLQLKSKNLKIETLKTILYREPDLANQLIRFLKKYQKPKVDAIAVTVGPGLEPCLWAGVNFAKALAFWWDIPVIPVNHIEAHILANFIDQSSKCRVQSSKLFPAICLVVSGGHTQIVLIKKIGQYKILGETRDDAAGECFDKTARLLGLEYPGGPAIAAEAAKLKVPASSAGRQSVKCKVVLPRPMIYSKDYDFSFSGLKTAVLYQVKKDGAKAKNKNYIQQMCYEIQQSIIDVLIAKTIKAAKDYRAKTIILGGGVSANKELRKQFEERVKKENSGFRFHVPSPVMCTDNAAMAAITGYWHFKERAMDWEKLEAKANLKLG